MNLLMICAAFALLAAMSVPFALCVAGGVVLSMPVLGIYNGIRSRDYALVR